MEDDRAELLAQAKTEHSSLPRLDFHLTTNDQETAEGLKLVADSIAQQRQLAAYALITHPFFLGAMGLAFASVYSYMYRAPSDAPLTFTTCVGVLMAGLVAIRATVAPYIELAESINYQWLADGRMIVASWGEGEGAKIIGALVFNDGKVSGSGSGRKGKRTVLIRAWTTKQRQRGHGVGKGLIDELVTQAKLKGADDVRYEEDSIYAKRLIPKWANGGFEERLGEAKRRMERYIRENISS